MSSPPSPSSLPTNPFQAIFLTEEDLTNPSQFISQLNNILSNVSQQLNSISGTGGGPITLNNHLNLNNNRISNVGDAVHPNDVVTQSFANNNYGAAALKPVLESLGKQVMQSYRRLNDKNQRESSSSFLNKILNTAPTSNTSFITYEAPASGTVAVTVGAGFHQRVDGSVVPYSSRTDTLALPTGFAIVSLVRSGNIVTATTSAPTGLSVNAGFSVLGAGDSGFDGSFVVMGVTSPTVFAYFQGGSNASTSGGSVSVGGVYYYSLHDGQTTLDLIGPFSQDTTSNRVEASYDGQTIIATVVTNSGGVDPVNSAAGGTPTQSGSNVAIIRRL